MMYAILRDGIIESIKCGLVTDEAAVPLPDDFQGSVGMHRDEFDDDWTLRPLSSRVAAGHVKPPNGYKIVGESFIEMTQAEKYRNGVVPIPDGFRLDGDSVRQMSLLELVESGRVTQSEAEFSQAALVRRDREEYFRIYDAAVSKLSREIRQARDTRRPYTDKEEELARWDDYAVALSKVPEQPGFPWEVSWPVRPDGVQL